MYFPLDKAARRFLQPEGQLRRSLAQANQAAFGEEQKGSTESLQPSHRLPFVLSRSYPLLPSASPIPTPPPPPKLASHCESLRGFCVDCGCGGLVASTGFGYNNHPVRCLSRFLISCLAPASFSQSSSWLNYPLSFLLPPGCCFSSTKELFSYTQSARLALSSGKENKGVRHPHLHTTTAPVPLSCYTVNALTFTHSSHKIET
ncbi:hypothetical protein QBC45DRAFT_100199 [Copromyces sp. CBS 386.78]|nr:hypothetical protein QBC45DRAFT_100199 [Copromyces sp. CBS 386.78]